MKISKSLYAAFIKFLLLINIVIISNGAFSFTKICQKSTEINKNIPAKEEELKAAPDLPIIPTPINKQGPTEIRRGRSLFNFFKPSSRFHSNNERATFLRIDARKSYFRGQILLKNKQYKKAMKEFEKSSSLDKEALKPKLQVAKCAFFLSNYKKGLKICNELLKRNPQYTPALILKGRIMEITGKIGEAMKIFNTILDYEPKNLEVLNKLGGLYYQHTANMEKTIEIYSQIHKINRKDIMTLVILGSTYALKGDIDKSLEFYSKAVHYRPRLVSSYLNLAKLFIESRNFEGAQKTYYTALVTAPENEEIQAGYQSFLHFQALRKFSAKKSRELEDTGKEKTSLSLRDIKNDAAMQEILQEEYLKGYRVLAEDESSSQPALIELYAKSLMSYKKYDKARYQYERILKVDPRNFKAQVALGNIALLKGDNKAALRAFDHAIIINPDNKEVYSEIGAAYLEQEDYEEALELYEMAIQVKPDAEKLQIILFGIYEKLKMYDKAESFLKNLLKNYSGRPSLYVLLGDHYRQREEYEKALKNFRKAYALKKSSGNIANMIITILLELDRPDEAREFTQDETRNLKRKKEFLVSTAMAFTDFGYYEKAIELLDLVRIMDPSNMTTYALTASVYNKKKEYKKAIDIIEKFQDDMPEKIKNSTYFELLASVYMEQRKYKKAIEIFQKAIQLEPGKENIYLSIAGILNRQKKYGEAQEILDSAFKHIERSSDKGMLMEAQFLTGQKKYDRAESLFKLLLSKNPEDTDLLYKLGILYYDAERFDEAEELLRKVIKKTPDNADAFNNLGYMFAEMGTKLDEAEELVKKALYLRPGSAYMLDSLAWIYFRKHQYEKSLEFLIKAENLSLDDPTLFDHLGDAYEKTGNMKKAREYWKRAYKIDPALKGLKEKLNK
jgi:tetratricopeptide (TPR) repeat protein